MIKQTTVGSVVFTLILISVLVETSKDQIIYVYSGDQIKFVGETGLKHAVYFVEHFNEGVVGIIDADKGKGFLKELDDKKIKYELQDMDELIAYIDNQLKETPTSRVGLFDYKNYNTLDSIYLEMDNMAKKVTNNWTGQVVTVGKSFERRDIKAIKISHKKPDPTAKTVVIMCGVHAREWTSITVCPYIMSQILEEKHTKEVNHYDYIIIPVLNVDGYVFTWSSVNISDPLLKHFTRFHRKNTQWVTNPVESTRKYTPQCGGPDLNRNFGTSSWCSALSKRDPIPGLTPLTPPCEDDYCGEAPFSAPETKALRDFLTPMVPTLGAFFDIHAFSGLWTYPKSWTNDSVPEVNELRLVSKAGVDAIKTFSGLEFKYGTAGQIMYHTEGSSLDWAYEVLKITYSFSIEVRPNKPGVRKGFNLNSTQIELLYTETWAGIEAALSQMWQIKGKSQGGVEAPVEVPVKAPVEVPEQALSRGLSTHMTSIITIIFLLVSIRRLI